MTDSADTPADRVDELLDRWELARERGQRLSPEELCVDYPEHIETIRQHIRSLESLTKFLEDRSVSGAESPLPEFVGGFRVLECLSTGGMGIVYLCLQENPRREVAVKTILPAKVTSESIERFRLEAHVLGLLRHPGIAQIYEAGETDLGCGNQPYIVLELVSGQPIDEYVEARHCAVHERIHLVAEVCDAVAHAHLNGVVHRDLKPANILVQDDGRPKILDFGIARLVDEAVKRSIAQHETVGLLGSLAYMSPEQIAGDTSVDEQTDVYSLGVLLYQLLSGRLPMDVAGIELGSVLRNIAERSPTPLGVLDKRFRGDLETIVSRAMAKDTATRYPSANDLSSELRRYLNGEPIAARPIRKLERAWRWCHRHRRVSAVVLAASVLGVAGISAAFYSALVVSEASDEASSAKQSERESLRLAERNRRRAESLQEIANRRQDALLREAFGATLLRSQQLGESNPVAALEILDDPAQCPPERRNLAWSLLRKQFDREVWSMEAHGRYHALSYSPNGELLVGLGYHGQLRAWNAESGELVVTRRGVLHRPSNVAFFRGSSRLVAADHSHAIIVWDSSSWEQVRSFTGHEAPIFALAVSPDDARVVSADKRGELKVWSSESGELLHSLRSDSKPFVALRFLPDGSLLSFSREPNLEVWDLSSGTRRKHFPLEATKPLYATFSADGRFVAATERATRNVLVWNASNGAQVTRLRLSGRSNSAPDFSADGTLLSCASRSRSVEVWSTQTWQRGLRFEHGSDRHVLGITFSPDGGTLASAGGDKFLRTWDLRSSRQFRSLVEHGSAIQDIERIRGSRRVAAIASDGSGWIVDPEAGRHTKIVVRSASVQRCSSSPSGNLLAVQDGDRQVAVFRTSDGKRLTTSPELDSDLRSLCFLNADDAVAVTTVNDPPILWRFSSKDATPLWSDSDEGGVLEPHAATGRLALGTLAGRLAVGSAASEGPSEVFSSHEAAVTVIRCSRDGERWAAGFADGTIVVWNWSERETAAAMTGHHERVYSLDFTADAASLISSGKDGTTRIWDVTSGQLQATLSEPFRDVRSLCLSDDDRALWAGTRDGRLLVVEIDSE